ncbi:hypothetical protein [Streptomyces sp. NPDC018693]
MTARIIGAAIALSPLLSAALLGLGRAYRALANRASKDTPR